MDQVHGDIKVKDSDFEHNDKAVLGTVRVSGESKARNLSLSEVDQKHLDFLHPSHAYMPF